MVAHSPQSKCAISQISTDPLNRMNVFDSVVFKALLFSEREDSFLTSGIFNDFICFCKIGLRNTLFTFGRFWFTLKKIETLIELRKMFVKNMF